MPDCKSRFYTTPAPASLPVLTAQSSYVTQPELASKVGHGEHHGQ